MHQFFGWYESVTPDPRQLTNGYGFQIVFADGKKTVPAAHPKISLIVALHSLDVIEGQALAGREHIKAVGCGAILSQTAPRSHP